MKCFVNILFFVLVGYSGLYGQRDVLNQFYINLPSQNPAFAGADDFMQVNLQFTQPWNNVASDAQNYTLSVFSPIGHSKAVDDIRRGSKISAPQQLVTMSQSSSIRRRHGVGLAIGQARLGPSKELDVAAYYAYHLPISKTFNISLGVSSGIFNQKIDVQDLTVRNETDDLFYQSLIQSSGSSTRFLTDFGLAVYSKKLYLALGAQSVIDELIQDEPLFDNFSRENTFNGLIGWEVPLSSRVSTHVTGSLSYSNLYDFRYKTALRVIFNETAYLGGAYHQDYKYSIIVGFNASKSVYINYAYDRYVNFLSDFANGSHNLTLSLQLFNSFNKSPLSW